MSRSVTIDRYPGLRPFEESERFMFFGRSMELEDLAQAININDLFVLHGESGLGKSSLINAGLIPLLREKDFYPILIRFKERNKPPLQQVLQELKKLSKDIASNEALREENKLWIWIKLMNSTNLKPVLIFDQFEEFSYFNADDRLVLVKELASLLSPRIPDYARDIVPGEEAVPNFSWFTQPKVKLLFSLRSDRISILEDFSDLMPAMLRSRYQLKPIMLEQVEQIVVMPAVMESFNSIHFASSPFQYQPALINDVIDVVKDKKRNTVETTQLQMICQEIEMLVKERQVTGEKNICVTQNDLPKEKLEDLVNDFYTKQLEKIHGNPEISPDEFIAIRVLIEKRLLVQKKRIPLAEGTVFQHFTDFFKEKPVTISDDKIKFIRDLLLSLRLIRDQTYGDSLFYELSHDTLIEPINAEMTARESEERRRQIQEDRRKQELEILKQKKYIDEINTQKDRAEKALRELEVAVGEQKKQTKIAQDTLAELKEVKTKEEKIRRRLSRIISGIVFAAFALIISYVIFLDKRNKKSNNLLARVYRNEGKNNYELGNHQLAYRFWKDALEKSTNEKLNAEVREELKRDFAAFAGMQTYVSPDGNSVAVRLRDSTWYFWQLGEKHARLLKTLRHRERLNFFNNGRWYYLIDPGRRLRIYNFSDSAHRRFKNAYIDLDTASVPRCTNFGDFFYVRPDYTSDVIFSLKPGGKLARINRFLKTLHDSSRTFASPPSHTYPVLDSTFLICSYGKNSYYLDLYRDAVFPLPCLVTDEHHRRFKDKLVVWSENRLQVLDLPTRTVKEVLPRFIDGKQHVTGMAGKGRYLFITDLSPQFANLGLFVIDVETGQQSRVADNFITFNAFYDSPDVLYFTGDDVLHLFNCGSNKPTMVLDSVTALGDYEFDKVFYSRHGKWIIADRSTLKTDTVLGDGSIADINAQLLAFETGDSTIVYDYINRKVAATLNPIEARRFYQIEGTKFLYFRPYSTSRYGVQTNPYYLKFTDSTMRINENLQRYFKHYLDDAMDVNK